VEYATDGVNLEGGSTVLVDQCVIQQNSNSGIYLTGSSNNLIRGSEIRENESGVSGGSSDARSNRFLGNQIVHNTVWGISFSSIGTQDDPTVFEDNVIASNGGGLSVNSLQYGRILNNRIFSNNSWGVNLGSSWFTEVQANVIYDNLGGINLGGTETVVAYNHVFGNTYGISLWGGRDNTVEHNSVYGNQSDGIHLDRSDGPNVTRHNAIYRNANRAILIQSTGHSVNYNNIFENEATPTFFVYDVASDVSAEHNYWGTTEASQIDALIYDYYDDFELGKVLTDPILPAADTSAPISAPLGVEVVGAAGEFEVSWGANPEPDVAGYRVFYDTDGLYPFDGTGANEGPSGIDVGNVTSFTLTGLDLSAAYHITVTAYDADADGSDDQFDGHESWFATPCFLEPPRVVGHTPEGSTAGPVDSVRIEFSHAMDQTSFSAEEDIISFSGPDGSVTVTGYDWVDDKTLELQFDPQSRHGRYVIVLGPQILDVAGYALDQDGDLVVGEVEQDNYAATFSIAFSGSLTSDTTWTPEHGVVLVNGPVTIATGVTLTIEPGTIAKFDGSSSGIWVEGTLDVHGTASEPVILTSYRDDAAGGDTNGDGDATRPSRANWAGIYTSAPGAHVELDYAVVRYADYGVETLADESSWRVSNSVISDNNIGLGAHHRQGLAAEAVNTLVANNWNTGVYFHEYFPGILRNCTIVGNGFAGGWAAAGVHQVGALIMENSIVAFNRNGFDSNAQPVLYIQNSLFYNPAGNELNFTSGFTSDVLSRDYNIISDPLFVDRAAGNYELDATSPATDSGRGIHAPTMDILGRSRYDDQGMPNAGVGFPAYVDMGAYERQESTAAADLAVVDVSNPNPRFASAGDTVTLEWLVLNVGTADATGAWQDVAYLSDDPHISPGDQVVGSPVEQSGPLRPGESYKTTLDVTVPDTEGPKYILVRTNAADTLREAVEANNLAASTHVLAVDVPVLETGVPATGTATVGQWDYYRYKAEPGRTVLFSLDGQDGAFEVYVRGGVPPTVSEYDASGAVYNQPDQEARLLDPVEGTYYVGMVPRAGTGAYTLTADFTTLDIRDVDPKQLGNADSATIKIVGEDFNPDAEVQLIASDGTIIEGDEYYQDPATLFATFDLAAAAAGLYDVMVVNTGSASVTEFDAVTVLDESVADFQTSITLPGTARPGRVITATVAYANTGSNDLRSPLLELRGSQECEWQLPGSAEWFGGSQIQFLALSATGPANILRPGQRESVDVRIRTPFSNASFDVSLHSVGVDASDGSEQPVDWATLEAAWRSPDVADTSWDPFWQDIVGLGDTWGDFIESLASKATTYSERVYSYDALFANLVNEALVEGAVADDRETFFLGDGYSQETTIETALGTSVATAIEPTTLERTREPKPSPDITTEQFRREFLYAVDTITSSYPQWEFRSRFDKLPGDAKVEPIDNWGVGIVNETGLIEAHLDADYISPGGDLVQNLWVAVIADEDYEVGGAFPYQPKFEPVYAKPSYNIVAAFVGNRLLDPGKQSFHLDSINGSTEMDLTPNHVKLHMSKLELADPDDIVVFYFTGHGERSPVSIATNLNNSRNGVGTITDEEFGGWLGELSAEVGHAVVILDTCHAAGMFDSVPSNVTWLAAATEERKTGGDPWYGGFFTFDLFNGLAGDAYDTNHDGRLSVMEALAHAQFWAFTHFPHAPSPTGNGKDIILLDDFRPFNWIQVIDTNAPLDGRSSPYVGVDPSSNGAPFYWTDQELETYIGNSTLDFIDYPVRGPRKDQDVKWRAMLIPTKWDGGRSVELFYQGAIWWGFDISAPKDRPKANAPMPQTSEERDKGTVSLITSSTPEDKFGPAGYDAPSTAAGSEERFITPEHALPYRIEFWNKEDALVPTQDAIIVDPLDPNVFDLSTLDFTRIGFLKWDVPLEGGQAIDTRIDLRPEMNLAVEVKAGLGMEVPGFAHNGDIDENTLVWWFHAIDPETGEWPEDPMAGFLPPFNPETGYEIGWVEFTIDPLEGLPTGTELANVAYVEFDFAGDIYDHPAPKKDPDVEPAEPAPWINTIDAGIPDDASQVEPLPAATIQTSFDVNWTGEDESGGSGIATYDIYVSIDDGPFALWHESTTETSDTYTGEIDHTYAFYSIATDNVGHREPAPPKPDAVTVVTSNPWHNPWNWYDVDGKDGVAPLDVLTTINYINAHPNDTSLPEPPDVPPPYYDVSGEGDCTALDVLMAINSINSGDLGPTIEITDVPNYAEDGFISGRVVGGDSSVYRVAPYIYIDGAGWWTKPTAETPTVEFDPDGNFTADVATGGIDNRATIYCAALVPVGTDPPAALGSARIPADLDSVAMDCRQRFGRTVEFAGHTWAVKESPVAVGPGDNWFSDDPTDVFVDQQGLHLTVNSHDDHWWATEVVLVDNLGYGTYSFQTNSRLDDLDPNVTFGAYTWDPYGDDESGASPAREIDFEDARWGEAGDPTNAQMVVQPHGIAGNKERYTIPDLSADAALTRFFTWQPDGIEFVAVEGHHTPFDYSDTDVIHRYVYPDDADVKYPDADHFVPTEGRESFRFNLWLYESSAPARGEPVEVVITDFSFWETPPNGSPEGEGISDASLSLAEATSLWEAGWPSRSIDSQAKPFDLLPQTDTSVADGVSRDDRGEPLVRASRDQQTVGSLTLDHSHSAGDLDADQTYLDSILPDIAADIATVWRDF